MILKKLTLNIWFLKFCSPYSTHFKSMSECSLRQSEERRAWWIPSKLPLLLNEWDCATSRYERRRTNHGANSVPIKSHGLQLSSCLRPEREKIIACKNSSIQTKKRRNAWSIEPRNRFRPQHLYRSNVFFFCCCRWHGYGECFHEDCGCGRHQRRTNGTNCTRFSP